MVLELNFIDVTSRREKPKATIHNTGRLGFNGEAAGFMNLHEGLRFKVAIDGGLDTFKNIYLVPTQEEERSVTISKSGQYFFLNMGGTFDILNLDYLNKRISFDIVKDIYEEQVIFVLKNKKEKERKSSDEE